MSRFPNRRWLVIPTTQTGSINFNEVLEHDSSSLRISLDGKETFVKYEITEVTESYTQIGLDVDGNEISSSIDAGVYGRPSIYSSEYTEYDHEGILKLLNNSKWTTENEYSLP